MPVRESVRERADERGWQVNPALLLLVTALVAGCPQEPPPRTVVVVCNDDSGVAEDFSLDRSEEALGLSTPCAKACANLSKLGCPESARLPGGKTCVETCKAIAPVSSYDPDCVIKAKSVDAVRKCPSVRC